MKTKPYPFQQEDVSRVVDEFKGRALIAWEMGLGKSYGALLAAIKLKASPIVIVCPASLKYQWRHQALYHLGLRAEIAEGRKPPRKNQIANTNRIVIVNYDILPKIRRKGGNYTKGWISYLKDIEPELVIFDEAHYLANPKSKRSKAAKSLTWHVPYVLCLTGTPFKSRTVELWHLLNITRPDKFSNFSRFAWKYSRPRKQFGHWNFDRSKNLPQLRARVKRICMVRRLKKDVMPELPERVRTILPVDISNRSEYNHANRDFLGWLKTVAEDGVVRRAARAEFLVRSGYLKRLAAEGKIKSIFSCIESFLQETDEKLVMFGIHKFMVKALREKFPNNSVVIDGSITGKNRQAAVDLFQTKDKIRLLFGNMQAGGVGSNLTAANNVDLVELPFVPADITQCLARIHRIGQKQTCFERFIVANDTIEVKLCQVLQKRQASFNEAIDGGSGEELNIAEDLSRVLLSKS